MTYSTLEEAVAELRKHPKSTVQARCGDLAVELRVVMSPAAPLRLGDVLAALGPWEGESAEELIARLSRSSPLHSSN